MDFDFSDDQEQLRDAVRKWVDRSYGFERRRASVKAGGFDRGAYGELVDLGLAGLYIPEEHGGMGMGPVEAMVAMEELGRGIVLEPLAQTLVASGAIGAYAPDAVKAQWLPKIASGEALVVLAQQERKARYRLEGAYAVEWAVRAVDTMFGLMGASGLYESGHGARAFRDAHAVKQHFSFNTDIAGTTYGRVALGLPSDNPTL